MKVTKHFFAITSFVLLGFSVPVLATNLANTKTIKQDNKISYLYVQRASSATLTKKTSNQYNLVLHHVAPCVIYFSNRPVRKAGLLSVKAFYQKWNVGNFNSFAKDSPNAGLVSVEMHHFTAGKDNKNIWTLSNPIYNANKATVKYTATAVGQASKSLPKTIKLKNVAIFIDGYCPTCNPPI